MFFNMSFLFIFIFLFVVILGVLKYLNNLKKCSDMIIKHTNLSRSLISEIEVIVSLKKDSFCLYL